MKRSQSFYSFMVITLVIFIITQSGVLTLMDNTLNAEETDGKTVTLTEGTNISVAVSPDHNEFIMDLQGVLWSFSSDNEQAKRITGNYDDPALPDWSPDGEKVVFQSYKSGNYHIWSMNSDGSNMEQLTTGQYDHREPSFSPDGSKIAFSSDRGGSYDVWVLDLESEELMQWTDGSEDEYQPTWSSDGNEIAFVTEGNTIKAIDQDGTSRALVTEENGTVFSPSWSPNGDDIIYVHQQSNESNLKISGEQLTNEEDVFPFPVKWLSENEIVYTADGKVKKRDIKTNESGTIPFEVELTIEKPDYKYKEQDFDSKANKQVKGIVAPTLSPNGKQIAFVALNDLWLLDVGKAKPKKLTDDIYYVTDPAWSPDGKKLAYSSDKSGSMDIYIKDLKTGKDEQLTSLPGAEVAASWSPDGTKIAFQDQDGVTYTVNIDDGEIREVIEPLFAPGHPTWGPNSDIVTIGAVKQFSQRFREGTNQILNVDLETGSETFIDPIPFKSLSNRVNSGPVWSPDGKYMAFVIESTLWVMEVDAKGNPIGEPRQLTEEVAESPSWSGDSDTLLYLSHGDLKTVSVKKGNSKKVPLNLKWKTEQTKEHTVIHVGKLWDGQSKEVKENMDIIVDGNRITDIKPHDNSHKGDYVDASDLTVIPGLWDAHVHQELSSKFFGSRQGRQLLAYGITSTISMGDPAYLIKEDYEAISSGARLSPRLFTSGEPIDGSRVYYDFMRPTTSKEQLQLELERAKEMEYDILKTYVRLPFDYQEIAIDSAHNDMGVPTFSHYWNPSMSFGQDGTSHISATQRLGFSRTRSASGLAYDDIIDMAAASEMAMTTTLFGSTTLLEFNPEFLSDERVKTLYTPWQYEALEQKHNNATSTDQTSARTSLERDVDILKEITNAGGTILGGTDIPLVDVAVSLHLNIQAMERYGMTPYDVLRTVTYLPAKEMGVEEDLGTIEVGKLADLVFVDGNPLEDMKAASNVRTVMKNGKMYTIDEILKPYTEADEDISASSIKALVEQFAEEGKITRNNVISVLTARLDTVEHFENKGEATKVIKHINGFKDRLDHHKEKGMITEEIYNALKEKADKLIDKWQ